MTTQLEIFEQENGEMCVKGDLTFATINKKTPQQVNFKDSRYTHAVSIDLSKVKSTDSAGLALMIEWIKLSKLHNTDLSFSHVPEQLLTLAKLSGFDKQLCCDKP